jgi:hypothetical protein
MGLVADFAHLPGRARHEAMKRNRSWRADSYFDARAARRVRGLSEGEGRL